jgi:hypothetical protein
MDNNNDASFKRKKKAPWNTSGMNKVYVLENLSNIGIFIGVWDNFDKTEIDAAGKPITFKCRLCDVSYKFGSTTSSKEHLSKRHEIEVKKKKRDHLNKENESEDSSDNEEPSKSKNEDNKHSNSDQNSRLERITKNKISLITKTLLLFIITACLPLRIVENVYFIKLIKLLCPSFTLPSRRALSTTTLDEAYDAIV